MPVLVDTNVLLDVATEDPAWFDWSVAQLGRSANRDGLAINPIVYAELSVHYESLEALETALSGHPFARLALPGTRPSSPARPTDDTGAGVERSARRCPISTSVPTRRWRDLPCSHATRSAIAIIFPNSRS